MVETFLRPGGEMDLVRATLEEELAWLRGRCGYEARQWNWPPDRADDLFQQSIVLFLHHTGRGWFDTKPRFGLRAQVRHLLVMCIRQAWSDMHRKSRRLVPLEQGDDDDDELDFVDPAPDADVRLHEAGQQQAVREAVLSLESPGRRLAVLALAFPGDVAYEHIAEAAAMKSHPLVLRNADEAWSLYRSHHASSADDTDWRRTVAEILRSTRPFGEADGKDVRRAVNTLEQLLHRATADLRHRLSRVDACQQGAHDASGHQGPGPAVKASEKENER